jgi:hypothetical protein
MSGGPRSPTEGDAIADGIPSVGKVIAAARRRHEA